MTIVQLYLCVYLLCIQGAHGISKPMYIDAVAPNSGPLGLELSIDLKIVKFASNSHMNIKGGIELGDEIVAINKQKLVEHTLDEVVTMIRSASTPKVLTFMRMVPESVPALHVGGVGTTSLNHHDNELRMATNQPEEGILELRVNGRQDSLLKIPIKESLFGGIALCSSFPFYIAPLESRQLCQPIFSEELNYIKGTILVVERGGCSFTDKALIASQMGVKALIVLNSPQERDIIKMPAAQNLFSEATALASIPSVMAHYSALNLIEAQLEKKHVGGKLVGRMFYGEGCKEDDGSFRSNEAKKKKMTNQNEKKNGVNQGGGGVASSESDREILEEGRNKTEQSEADEFLMEEERQKAAEKSKKLRKALFVQKVNQERLDQAVGGGVFHILSGNGEQLLELEFIAGGMGGSIPLSPLALYPLVISSKHDQSVEGSNNDEYAARTMKEKKRSLSTSSMKVRNIVENSGEAENEPMGSFDTHYFLNDTRYSFPTVSVKFREMRPNDRLTYVNLIQEKEKEISSQKLTDWIKGEKKATLLTSQSQSQPPAVTSSTETLMKDSMRKANTANLKKGSSLQSESQQVELDLESDLESNFLPSSNDMLFDLWNDCGVIDPLYFEPNAALLLEWPPKFTSSSSSSSTEQHARFRNKCTDLTYVVHVLGEYYRPAFIAVLSDYSSQNFINEDYQKPDLNKLGPVLLPLENADLKWSNMKERDVITPVIRLAPIASKTLNQFIFNYKNIEITSDSKSGSGSQLKSKRSKETSLYISLSYSSHVERAWQELSTLYLQGNEAWPYSEKAKEKAALTLKAMHGDWSKLVSSQKFENLSDKKEENFKPPQTMLELLNSDISLIKKDGFKSSTSLTFTEYLEIRSKWSLPIGQDYDRAQLLLALWHRIHPFEEMPSRSSVKRIRSSNRKAKSKSKNKKKQRFYDLQKEEGVDEEDGEGSLYGIRDEL